MITMRKAHASDMGEIMDLVDVIFEREQDIPRELSPIPEHQQPQWWCAEMNRKIVGTAALYKDNGIWHMGRIAVSGELRGQHIATKLLCFALEDIFSQNIDEVHLEARDITVHIMQNLGAKVIGEPVPFYKGTVTPIILKKSDFFQKQKIF